MQNFFFFFFLNYETPFINGNLPCKVYDVERGIYIRKIGI